MKLGEIVHDSIIENKEKTKSYWEQLMIAANIPTSSPDVKQSNNIRSLSSQINLGVMNSLRPVDTEPSDGPKIVETVTKNNLPEKNETNVKTTKRSSVIEREIEMQKEREAAFAQEREEALGILKVKSRCSNSEMRVSNEHDENLNLSIPTTDDGNFSEYGSEEKEGHSLDESRISVPSPEMTAVRSSLHRRTQSMDSMSSGHSSGSIGSAGSGIVPEPYVRRRLVTVRPIDQPEEESLFVIARSDKETPIEREIRLSKEREEELRRGKQLPPSSNAFKSRSKSLTCELISMQPETDSIKPTQQTLPLNRGVVRKLGNQKVFYNITHSKSASNILDKELEPQNIAAVYNTPSNSPTNPQNSYPSAKGAVPKLFSRNPNQKGLMKRFIASGGKLNSTFTFSPSRNGSSSSSGSSPISPAVVHKWNSYVKSNKDTNLVGTRPGYVSAEDKIQVELQEMRKREQELKEQRARSFIRSQPDLLSLLNQEEEEEKHEIGPLKLRSARSNPNLIDMDENSKLPTDERKPLIKRSALIDVWESMIQNVQ